MKIADYESRGTGWRLKSINHLDVGLTLYSPMKGGCARIKLPKAISNQKIFPLLKTNDEMCLKWAISYCLAGGKNSEITSAVKEKADSFNWDEISFPAEKRDIEKFEKNNPNYLVYAYSYIGKEFGIFHKHKNFKELEKEKEVINILFCKNHFFPILDEKYLHSLIFSRDKIHVCKNCLTSYSSENELEFHYTYCQDEFKSRITFPEKGEFLEFKNFSAENFLPYFCIIDSECKLEPCQQITQNTEKYQKHKPCYFGLLFYDCLKDKSEYSVYDNGRDLIERLIYYSEFVRMEKPLEGKQKEKADKAFEKAKSCGKCGIDFSEDNHAVRDHCHYTGKFRDILCNNCNLKYKRSKILPVFGHNLMKYDEKTFFKHLLYDTTITAKNMENFISFRLRNYNIKFFDSFKFLSYSLETLVSGLKNETFKITRKEFPKKLWNLCYKKGFFP